METITPQSARATPILHSGRIIIIIRLIKWEVLVTQLLTAGQVILLVTNVVAKDIYCLTHHARNMVNQVPILDLTLSM
jgi:hypothetical protein